MQVVTVVDKICAAACVLKTIFRLLLVDMETVFYKRLLEFVWLFWYKNNIYFHYTENGFQF